MHDQQQQHQPGQAMAVVAVKKVGGRQRPLLVGVAAWMPLLLLLLLAALVLQGAAAAKSGKSGWQKVGCMHAHRLRRRQAAGTKPNPGPAHPSYLISPQTRTGVQGDGEGAVQHPGGGRPAVPRHDGRARAQAGFPRGGALHGGGAQVWLHPVPVSKERQESTRGRFCSIDRSID